MIRLATLCIKLALTRTNLALSKWWYRVSGQEAQDQENWEKDTSLHFVVKDQQDQVIIDTELQEYGRLTGCNCLLCRDKPSAPEVDPDQLDLLPLKAYMVTKHNQTNEVMEVRSLSE